MSVAYRSTDAPASARITATPDGPPVPVTSTRGGRGRARVAVAPDLERLDVARLREAAPVPGRRAQQLLVEVVARRRLRHVRADDLELGLDEVIDRDEARGPELDRRRRALVAVDPRYAAGRDERGAVDVAVVLMDVVRGVRVDRGR